MCSRSVLFASVAVGAFGVHPRGSGASRETAELLLKLCPEVALPSLLCELKDKTLLEWPEVLAAGDGGCQIALEAVLAAQTESDDAKEELLRELQRALGPPALAPVPAYRILDFPQAGVAGTWSVRRGLGYCEKVQLPGPFAVRLGGFGPAESDGFVNHVHQKDTHWHEWRAHPSIEFSPSAVVEIAFLSHGKTVLNPDFFSFSVQIQSEGNSTLKEQLFFKDSAWFNFLGDFQIYNSTNVCIVEAGEFFGSPRYRCVFEFVRNQGQLEKKIFNAKKVLFELSASGLEVKEKTLSDVFGLSKRQRNLQEWAHFTEETILCIERRREFRLPWKWTSRFLFSSYRIKEQTWAQGVEVFRNAGFEIAAQDVRALSKVCSGVVAFLAQGHWWVLRLDAAKQECLSMLPFESQLFANSNDYITKFSFQGDLLAESRFAELDALWDEVVVHDLTTAQVLSVIQVGRLAYARVLPGSEIEIAVRSREGAVQIVTISKEELLPLYSFQ